MKSTSLLLLVFALSLPLMAAEEAKMAKGFGPMNCGFNDYRIRTNTAETAVSALHFNGEVLPATAERLKQVWNSGKNRGDRLEALHAWMKELEKDPNSTDAQVFLAWQAAHIWFASHGTPEHDLFLQHIRHTFSSPAPAESRHLMVLFHNITGLEYVTGTGCSADDFISLADAVNGVHPWLLNALYPLHELYFSRMDDFNRLWRDPAAYAPQYLNSRHERVRRAVHYLMNDVPYLYAEAKAQGLRRWRDTWSKDLPPAVNAALEAAQTRRRGVIADAAATAKRIRSLAVDLPPEMQGFVPRSILAVAPTATVWKPLWDEKASLYDMPDTTAVSLPGWNLNLLSKEGKQPAEVLKTDTARLTALLQQAKADKTLPALLAFSLIEDDLALPDETHRSWMDVDGYDSFRAVFDIVVSPHLTDVLIDEKGPHFSKDDAKLRAACRELNLTLHRCIVALALLEQQGDTKGVQQGCDALSELLNTTKTWPLVFNEYGLRGISPAVFTGLVARCKGKPALLRGFAELARAMVAYYAAEQEGNGVPDAARLADYLRSMLVLRHEWPLPEAERAEVAAAWLNAAQKQIPATREAMEQYAFAFGAPDALLKEIPDDAADYSCRKSPRGFALYRYAAEQGDDAAAERIIRGMTANPLSYGYPATRLACAMHARRQGQETEAQRFEKDALVLYLAEAQYADGYDWWQSSYAFLQYGSLDKALKLMNMRREPYNRSFLALAVPALLEQRHYEAAAFAAEQLITLSLRDAAPLNSCGTQRQIVCWRAMADIGHALHLYAKGENDTADKLLTAALPLLCCDAALAARVLPVLHRAAELDDAHWQQAAATVAAAAQQAGLEEIVALAVRLEASPRTPAPAAKEADGVTAAAAHDLSFESPEYTWHLKDSGGTFQVVKGRIESAWYESETESCWVRIRTSSGRCIEPRLNEIATEDIAHLLDWRKRNRIEVFHPSGIGNIFHAKLCRLYSDADVPTPDNTYAELLRPYGERRVMRVSRLSGKEQAALMKQPVERVKPELRTADTLSHALIHADAEGYGLRLCFLGKRGGAADSRFRADILSHADKVRAWNRGKVTLLCYSGADGTLTDEAQQAYDMVTSALDALLPPDSPLRAELLQNGCTIEIPHTQEFGNRNAAAADDVRLDIQVKPLFPQAENAALCQASAQGKSEEVQHLLSAGAAAHAVDAEGNPALFLACRAGSAAAVKLLLEHGADAAQRPLHNMEGVMTPLEAAQGNPDIVQLLADGGAPLTTAVFGAVLKQEGGLAAANALLTKHKPALDWDVDCPLFGGSLLQYFSQEKNVEVVDWLLDRGADVRVTESAKRATDAPRSVLLWRCFACEPNLRRDAAQNARDYALLETFLKHGLDPSYAETDLGGNSLSLLGNCISNGQFDLALLLLQHGAKGNITCGGIPVFYKLTELSDRPENADKQATILQLADALVEHGANPAQNAKKPWPPIKAYIQKHTSDSMRRWMEKHL